MCIACSVAEGAYKSSAKEQIEYLTGDSPQDYKI